VIAQVPELADGGYWYVVASVPDPLEGGQTPGDIPPGWCAWYGNVDGVDCAVVRMPQQAVIPEGPDVAVSDVLTGWPGKPYGRIEGA